MPRAEIGSTKHLNNKLKSKGLQRLRWYCQVCERQMRDENGFKMHVMSESHVRQMVLVGEDPKKYINDYSNQFKRDFLQLLRTSHGEKSVQLNHFYQEYIANKEHVHMNATKWPSLTELAKYLGREGICRVEETDKGLHIAWIDNSPEALRRQDAIRKKDRQDRGDEEREQALIREQVRKAKLDAGSWAADDEDGTEGELKRAEGETIKLSFGPSLGARKSEVIHTHGGSPTQASLELSEITATDGPVNIVTGDAIANADAKVTPPKAENLEGKVSMKMTFQSKPKNVFAVAKKNALGGKKTVVIEKPKKMSEAERIMKEEIERKRVRNASHDGDFSQKRQKL